jgi:hypothetical protein
MAGVYQSTLAWDPSRPDTTIITCVDGRWYSHFQEFAHAHRGAGPRTDFVAVPGGIEPLTLVDLMPKDFNFFRRRLEALVESHGTRRIVAIAHQDCAWYKARKLGPPTFAKSTPYHWAGTRMCSLTFNVSPPCITNQRPAKGRWNSWAFAHPDARSSNAASVRKLKRTSFGPTFTPR